MREPTQAWASQEVEDLAVAALEDALAHSPRIPAKWRVGILLYFHQALRRRLRKATSIEHEPLPTPAAKRGGNK